MENSAEFRERQAGPNWLRWLAVVVDVFLIGIIALVFSGVGHRPPAWVVLFIPILMIVVGCFVTMVSFWSTIEIVVADGIVTAQMGFLRVLRARIDELTDVSAANITAMEAGGTGFKWTPSGTYLLWHAGPAVRIRTRRGRVVYLQTQRPRELRAALKSAKIHNP